MNSVTPLSRLAKINDPIGLCAVLECILQLCKNNALLVLFKKEKLDSILISSSSNKLNENLQIVSLELLALFAYLDLNVQSSILKSKSIPLFSKNLKGTSLPLQIATIKVLGACCSGTNRKHQQEARKNKVIEGACLLLKEKDVELLIATSNAISYIVDSNTNNQNLVRKNGGVDSLTPLTTHENQTMQQAVLQCTRACVKHNAKLQHAFRTKKVINPLVQLLSSPNDAVKSLTAGAMIELGRDNPKNCDAIAVAGAIPLLVKELDNPSDAVKYHCQGVLWALSRKNKKRKEAIRATGAVEILKRLQKETSSEQVKKGCKWALETLGK